MNAAIQNKGFVEPMQDGIKCLESCMIGSNEWEYFDIKIKECATTKGRHEAVRGRAAQKAPHVNASRSHQGG